MRIKNSIIKIMIMISWWYNDHSWIKISSLQQCSFRIWKTSNNHKSNIFYFEKPKSYQKERSFYLEEETGIMILYQYKKILIDSLKSVLCLELTCCDIKIFKFYYISIHILWGKTWKIFIKDTCSIWYNEKFSSMDIS